MAASATDIQLPWLLALQTTATMAASATDQQLPWLLALETYSYHGC